MNLLLSAMQGATGPSEDTILGISMDKISEYAMAAIAVLAILFVGWIIAGWTKRIVARSLKKAKVDETLIKFFAGLAKTGILIMVILTCLSRFGVEITAFAAVIAAAGFAIGLAFQGTLSNFSSGVMLLTFRPFKVGDVVTVAGHTGKIDEIELFVTKMDTPDNRRIIIPNSAIFGSTIENITHHDTRRVDVAVGVDYSADTDTVRQVLQKAANQVLGRIKEMEPQVVLVDLGDSSVNWTVRVWAKTPDFFAVKEAATREIKMALDQAGIGIPFPQMDIHMDSQIAEALSAK